jgi:hypothetical protein
MVGSIYSFFALTSILLFNSCAVRIPTGTFPCMKGARGGNGLIEMEIEEKRVDLRPDLSSW